MDKEKAKNSSIKAALKKLRHPWRLAVVLAMAVIVSIVAAVNVVPAAVSSIQKVAEAKTARAAKASEPRAWFAAYSDGRTTNLRVAELLEVHTDGFSPDAQLEYTYSGITGRPYSSPDTATFNYTYGDKRYFAVSYGSGRPALRTLKVIVKDTNTNSSTYQKRAIAEYSNFEPDSLQKDVEMGVYGLFAGDDKSVLELLGSGGVVCITCYFSHTEQVSIKSGDSVSVFGEGDKATINAVKSGKAACSIKVRKDGGCAFHNAGMAASVDISLFVFDKPVISQKKIDTITVSNTQKDVTYTVNGVSQKCTEDGQELTFTGLEKDGRYSVKCSTEVDGRTVKAYTDIQLSSEAVVSFNNNNHGNKTPASQKLDIGSKVTKPENLTEEGYYMDGWVTSNSASAKKWDFDNDVPGSSMTLYANWKSVPNTLNVNLKKDDVAWTGQNVALYSGTKKAYDLTESNGVYTSSEVVNGTYDIYVNGENVNRPVTFDTTATVKTGGQTKETTLEYSSVDITTTLNDSASSVPGKVELRQGNMVWNTFENKDGNIKAYALKEGDGTSGNTYDIYVGGTKVRETVDASKKNSITIGYYKAQLELNYDSPWKDAVVTLKDEYGNEQYRLAYEKADGNKTYYSRIIRAEEHDSTASYYVYVGNQNTHQTVRLAQANVQSSDYQKAVTFYKASVAVRVDDLAKKFANVTLDNGTDITQLDDFDEDGIYTASVYKNYSGADELLYDVKVSGTTDETPAKVSSSAKSVVVDYYTVETHVTTGGVDVTNSYIVRKDMKISSPASKVNNGRKIEGWYTDTGYNTNYNFNKAVTSLLRLYGKFEGQKVAINGYIKTNSSGTQSSDGTYYRMSNLTISGFMTGKVMSGFMLETTGCKNITINADSSLGSFTVMPDSNKSGSVITVEDGKLFVQFNSPVTMKDMQKFIRNNVIVQPDATKEHSMQVTVYGLTD